MVASSKGQPADVTSRPAMSAPTPAKANWARETWPA